MSIQTLTDTSWKKEIEGKAALVLFTDGDGLRGDFSSAFKKAAAESDDILFAEIHPGKNPEAASHFSIDGKPVMIGWYKDDVKVRRSRPWGTDVVGTIQILQDALKEDAPPPEPEAVEDALAQAENNGVVPTEDHPVNVTDASFQQEVIDMSHTVPVLVDFWAEWCGPCRQVAPILEKLAGEFAGQIRVAKVDVDQNPALSQAFRVQSIPTIMVYKSGQPIFMQPGAFPEDAFRDLIQQAIALEVPEETEEEPAQ